MTASFDPCEICGSDDWQIVYRGPVRDGAFGNLTGPGAAVGRCGGCGVERLDEATCKEEDFYRTEEYRALLAEPTDAAGFFAEHDAFQLQNLTELWPESVRGKVVADIGCAAGSFLDHIAGLAGEVVALEPCEAYHESLRKRGYTVYSNSADAVVAASESIDLAFSFAVIEHVRDPHRFLADIALLIKPSGKLLLSTPNRSDFLMDLLPEDYPRFFYRAVHRWYFDAESLRHCAERAGFTVVSNRCHHRFGLSNAFGWLRDRKPSGSKQLPHIDSQLLDSFWRHYLEMRGIGDCLYATLARKD
ncbi:MAG: class I SAM-dependent methyltransferase [Gammaproteobacteria bacterium]|nr:class I SAM-dependent methyltransferase [Gammaproteobacteria bacterium]